METIIKTSVSFYLISKRFPDKTIKQNILLYCFITLIFILNLQFLPLKGDHLKQD